MESLFSCFGSPMAYFLSPGQMQVGEEANIRNRYNQVPQDFLVVIHLLSVVKLSCPPPSRRFCSQRASLRADRRNSLCARFGWQFLTSTGKNICWYCASTVIRSNDLSGEDVDVVKEGATGVALSQNGMQSPVVEMSLAGFGNMQSLNPEPEDQAGPAFSSLSLNAASFVRRAQ